MSAPNFVFLIHGGAGVIGREVDREPYTRALKEILVKTFKFALAFHTAVDIVEYAVSLLEDEPLFNAGKGAVFAADGTHQLEASLMDGASLRCGAVSMIRTMKNPINTARIVMEHTNHNWICGGAAEALGVQHGLAVVENSYFDTEVRRKQLETAKATSSSTVFRDHDLLDDSTGTVGCVCMYDGPCGQRHIDWRTDK